MVGQVTVQPITPMQLLVLALLSLVLAKTSCPGKDRCTLVWECAERCSPFSLKDSLNFLAQHKKEILLVSPEAYQVGKNGQFEAATHNGKPMTDMRPGVTALGYQFFPMLTSGNINDLRLLWQNPKPFVEASLIPAKNYRFLPLVLQTHPFSFLGYHIDFEPESGVVASDAAKYCTFLDYFAEELHKNGFILSVDVARWSPLWDFQLLAKTKVTSLPTYLLVSTHTPR